MVAINNYKYFSTQTLPPECPLMPLLYEQEENPAGRIHNSIHHVTPPTLSLSLSHTHTHTHKLVEYLPQVPFRINHNHAGKPHTTATGCGESQYPLFYKSATKSEVHLGAVGGEC
jgi:hypothetical protein